MLQWTVSVVALGGIDYTPDPITATFIAGTNTTTINVSVIMDDIVEGTEMFNLIIILPPLNSDVTLDGQSIATVNIYDSTG